MIKRFDSRQSSTVRSVPLKATYVRVIVTTSAAAFFLSTVLALLVATRSLPLTDGWYESLNYLASRGLRPYREIEFLLPPVTPLFFSLLDALTGRNLAWHKIIGVLLSLFNSWLIFVWLRRTHGASGSFIAAFVFFLIETTGPAYIARDYHSLVTTFTVCCLILMMSPPFGEKGFSGRLILLAGLAGVSAQFLFMTKQTVGLLIPMGFSCFLAISGIIHATLARRVRLLLPQAVYLAAFVGTVLVSPSDRPILKLDTVAPSAERRRIGGGKGRPANSIVGRATVRRNAGIRAGVIGVAARSAGVRPRLRQPIPRGRTPRADARSRGAKVSAQRTIPDFFAATGRGVKSTSCPQSEARASGFAARLAVRRCGA
jgi:hypothetical protein